MPIPIVVADIDGLAAEDPPQNIGYFRDMGLLTLMRAPLGGGCFEIAALWINRKYQKDDR